MYMYGDIYIYQGRATPISLKLKLESFFIYLFRMLLPILLLHILLCSSHSFIKVTLFTSRVLLLF